MELTLLQQTLIWSFVIAFIMGAVVTKTNFCTMGAVSDWVNIKDTGRMRAWIFAIGLAILGIAILNGLSVLDISLAESHETGKPPYLIPQFSWLRHVLGGLLFGIGMTLGSGCGNKTFVRIGSGNFKSVIVFLAMGIGAYLMIYTDYGYIIFLSWLPVIDLSAMGLNSQSIGELVSHATGLGATAAYTTALIIGGLFITFSFASSDFRSSFDNVLGGTVVAIAVILAWYVTAGPLGQTLIDEVAFLDTPPYDVGAQSFTFVKPTGQFYYWVENGFAFSVLSFSLLAGFGVIVGSFTYSLFSKSFRVEWFVDKNDFLRHLIGGLMMGIGGVLSLGCTFGQAITGASTLALGSFVTFVFIVLGAALSMKTQYYQMVYEDEATIGKALVTALCDFKLLPSKLRQFDDI